MNKRQINKIRKRIKWLRDSCKTLEDLHKEFKCFLDCIDTEMKIVEREVKKNGKTNKK